MKLLAHFVARADRRGALLAALEDEARRAAEEWGARTALYAAREQDPLRRSGLGEALPRAFDATLELDPGERAVDLAAALAGVAARLDAHLHRDLSSAQVGRDRVFVPCEPAPVRYQYCMRRRPEWSHADYLVRYAEGHSPIGVRTEGKRGYTQLHADLEAGAAACAAAGFGAAGVDSVAQLDLDSLEAFLAAGRANARLGASEDEDQFVDRAASLMWVSDAVARFGPGPARRGAR